MITISIIIVLVLLVLGLLYLNYLKFFSPITLEEKKYGPFTLVYEEYTGPYKDTAKIQNDLYYSLLNKEKIKTFKGFGVYYDNPKKVPAQDLRSIAGCVLEQEDYEKVGYLETNGYKVKNIPEQDCIVVEFPFKNSFSIFVGMAKVYPEIEKYIKDHNLENNEIMEIYDMQNKKIFYSMRK